MRRQIAASAAGFAVMLVAACSSDPTPAPTPASSGQQTATDGGSEVDRSSAKSTALAFARMYAAGDLPQACELANADGRKTMKERCSRQGDWSTTVALFGQCQSGDDRVFHFTAPVGTIDRNSDLVVWVNETDGIWSVNAASTPASTQSPIMTCDSENSTGASPSSGSVSSLSSASG